MSFLVFTSGLYILWPSLHAPCPLLHGWTHLSVPLPSHYHCRSRGAARAVRGEAAGSASCAGFPRSDSRYMVKSTHCIFMDEQTACCLLLIMDNENIICMQRITAFWADTELYYSKMYHWMRSQFPWGENTCWFWNLLFNGLFGWGVPSVFAGVMDEKQAGIHSLTWTVRVWSIFQHMY